MRELTKQELHNLAMNIVGKHLQAKGYEFLAINSQLKKHPQFVLFKKNEPTIFVLVKASSSMNPSHNYDNIWMESFKEHASKSNAKVWYAEVGLANAVSVGMPIMKDQPYYVAFDDVLEIL